MNAQSMPMRIAKIARRHAARWAISSTNRNWGRHSWRPPATGLRRTVLEFAVRMVWALPSLLP